MKQVFEIKKDLKLLVQGNYPHTKNSRLNEYAEYEDFEVRYIKGASESVYLEAIIGAFVELDDKDVSTLTWLLSSFNIQLYKVIIPILKVEKDLNKKHIILEQLEDDMTYWSGAGFKYFSDDDKKLLLSEFKQSGFTLSADILSRMS